MTFPGVMKGGGGGGGGGSLRPVTPDCKNAK